MAVQDDNVEGEMMVSTRNKKRDKKKDKKEKKEKKHKERGDDGANELKQEQEDKHRESQQAGRKQKKKRKRSDDENDSVKNEKVATNNIGQDDKKTRRAMKRQSKEELLALVPKADPETGITFTKLQIRRMLKRVKRGLAPIPTLQEEQQRLKNEAELRKEEEAELAGLIYSKDEEDDDEESEEAEDVEDPSTGKGDTSMQVEDTAKEATFTLKNQERPPKKSKRNKPVPLDYTCQACQNRHQPAHWIYDCPEKVTMRGTNQKKKRERGLHDPDSRKVFVSGLPFDVKGKDVSHFFEGSCGKLLSCKLVKFEDTGRCNGQAYLTFEGDDAAKQALKLSGTVIDANALLDNSGGNKKKKGKDPSKRKDLKLKVSKVLNRRKTQKAGK
mmetsp:Transcript_15971/g.29659  ORF Transcript_15971/g.29659 Transcript_15971/m.29659 type:complete len:386 (+) Transcript_15971:123-1280(+)